MEGEPRSGLLAEDDGESDEFLCGVAVECVNDALLVLDCVDTAAKAELRKVLAILVEQATICGSTLRPWQSLKRQPDGETEVEPLPGARQVIKTYVGRMAQGHSPILPPNPGSAERASHEPEIAARRQRASLLLMEALSLLGDAEDMTIASHVQIAIDRVGGDAGTRLANSPRLPRS